MPSRILFSIFLLGLLGRSFACAEPPELLFHLSFDSQTATADFACGDRRPQSAVKDLHFVPGVKGQGLFLQPGQRCVYSLAKNLDTSQGTFSC